MSDREELQALRRMAELEARVSGNPDANLGGTLQVGVPFTNARLDTGIPLPHGIEAGIVGAGKTTARLLQGINPFTDGAQVAEENHLYAPLAQAHPVATTAGEIAPYLAGTSIPAMIAMSAAEYGTPKERAERAGMALAGGALAQGAARLIGPKSMAPASNEFFDYGNKFEIPLRAAQLTDSKPIQITDAVLANLPISSGVIAKAKDASYQGFNRAATRTFGADSTQITPELLGQYKNSIGGTIGDIAGRNTMNVTQDVTRGLDAVRARAADELVGSDAELVGKWVDRIEQYIVPKIDPKTGTVSGAIPGNIYKALDSKLGIAAKSGNGTVKDVLGDLRSVMRDGMDASITPEDAAAWQKARREYFNLQQVAEASKATPGSLSPTQLLQSVNRSQKNARFGGGNDLAELAQFAKPVLGDQIPNSGTAQRLFYQRLLTSPLTTIGSIGGAAYGADQLGINPADAIGGGLLAYGLARGMAGKPASELTRKLLTQSGGLLGLGFAP